MTYLPTHPLPADARPACAGQGRLFDSADRLANPKHRGNQFAWPANAEERRPARRDQTRPVSRRTRPEPGIPARYESSCPRCDDPIHIGDRVVHQRGRYLHVACCSGWDE